jgi:hypothetical protein
MMTAPVDQTAKTIVDKLDGRERYVLAWIERQVSMPYREISGESLDALIRHELVKLNPTSQPRACWPVTCTELGTRCGAYLRKFKTISHKKA